MDGQLLLVKWSTFVGRMDGQLLSSIDIVTLTIVDIIYPKRFPEIKSQIIAPILGSGK